MLMKVLDISYITIYIPKAYFSLGRSLKAERQQQRYTKKEIKEMADKRRQKKEKKRMDFYLS